MTWFDVLFGMQDKQPGTITEPLANIPTPNLTVRKTRTCYVFESAKYGDTERRTFVLKNGKTRRVPQHYTSAPRMDVVPDSDGIVDLNVRGTKVSIRVVGWNSHE